MKESKLPIKIKAHHGYDVMMLNEQGLYKQTTLVIQTRF